MSGYSYPHNDRFASLKLLGVIASVGGGIFLVLKIGFLIHHDPQPPPFASPANSFLALVAFLGGLIAGGNLAGKRLHAVAISLRVQKEAATAAAAREQLRQERAAELRADPRRAKYAPLVERGEDWPDEKIAYHESPEITATCEHLRPIERAMRLQGIDARLYKNSDIVAKCRIDAVELIRVFDLRPPTRYAEFYQGERSERDHPTAFLICDEHKSIIHTLHPEEAGAPELPSFPRP